MEKENARLSELQERYEDQNVGNFRRIYPVKDDEKYERFLSSNASLYQETVAFKARSECARYEFGLINKKFE
ncbi:unnamed protein product [Protopolystoma xenopodis]|uniref:Uncharacterized protein n=1 Tax=Protopolystoma xenopodis TaxID=117903 RepID=A0A448WPU6_9PLAT|nr:unnamed protein product [Protopolystoma xenopodis]